MHGKDYMKTVASVIVPDGSALEANETLSYYWVYPSGCEHSPMEEGKLYKSIAKA